MTAWVLGAALLSGMAGWQLPRIIASLPERGGDDTTTFVAIASATRLRLALAALAALVGALLGGARAGEPDLAAFLVLGVLGVGMGYVDLRRHLLPDRFTVSALGSGAVLLGVAALVPQTDAATSYPRAWACAGGLMLCYLVLALVHPAGLGFGDVKLASGLGLHLGWLGWSYPLVGTVAAFVVGALVSLALMTVGRAGRRTAVAFGPSMLLGALVAVLLAEPIAAWYLG